MTESNISAFDLIAVSGDRLTTDSHRLAKHFDKPHKYVLRRMRELIAELPADHGKLFSPMVDDVEVGKGAICKTPYCLLTIDGFMLLAMGFTSEGGQQRRCREHVFSSKQLCIGGFTLCFSGGRNAQRRKWFLFGNHDVSYKQK
jgi:Phage regulatory protein Rha (Phage_pRha)